MIRVPIQDSVFLLTGARSMGGLFCEPAYVKWEAVMSGNSARFYTESDMRDAPNHPRPRIGWLIHAPPFAQSNYDWALAHEDDFDYVLTSIRQYITYGTDGKWLWYPHGGSHISFSQWTIYPKTKLVSMLASCKNIATGHRLRHEIKAKYGDRIDVLGSINGGHNADKVESLAPYCYSVVVCCERNDWDFTDHLIDCIAVGTIPIYWGCPEIGRFFNASGIISFEEADDLPAILSTLSPLNYKRRLPAVQQNIELAKQYRVPEDWIHTHYEFLFEGLQ